jgi:hypothetical protein
MGFRGSSDIFEEMIGAAVYEGKDLDQALTELYECYDNGREPPFEHVAVDIAVDTLEKCRKERRQNSGKDKYSKLFSSPLRSMNNTISKFYHEGCETVLHVGSGSENCLSQYSFPGSVVQCVDLNYGEGRDVETMTEREVQGYDCVVSDLAVYDKVYGGLTPATNDLVCRLVKKVSDNQHLVVKLCVAGSYDDYYDRYNWKVKFKNRGHNLEIVVERVKHGYKLASIFHQASWLIYHVNLIRQKAFVFGHAKTSVYRKPTPIKWFFPRFDVDVNKLKGQGSLQLYKVLMAEEVESTDLDLYSMSVQYGFRALMSFLN